MTLKLIGLAHAGGSAAALAPLRRHLPCELELLAVELPGRGARRREPLKTQRPALVAQLSAELAPHATAPYALFGHSLGATLAFELAHALIARGAPAPSALFVAAAAAPSRPPPRLDTHLLSDAELAAELRRLGGTPPEVLDHPQLLQLCLPIVRADFQLCAGVSPQAPAPLPCPIHLFAGRRDRLSLDELVAWRHETEREFSLSWFEADHFFISTHAAQLCAALVQQLSAAGLLAPGAWLSPSAY